MDDPERHLLGNLLETTLGDDDLLEHRTNTPCDASRRRSFTYPTSYNADSVNASQQHQQNSHGIQWNTSQQPHVQNEKLYWAEASPNVEYYQQQQHPMSYYPSNQHFQRSDYPSAYGPSSTPSSPSSLPMIAQQLAYVRAEQEPQEYFWMTQQKDNKSVPQSGISPPPGLAPLSAFDTAPIAMQKTTSVNRSSHFPPQPPLGATVQPKNVTGITIQNMSAVQRVPVATVGPMPSYSSVASKRPTMVGVAAKITGSVMPTVRKASIDGSGKFVALINDSDLKCSSANDSPVTPTSFNLNVNDSIDSLSPSLAHKSSSGNVSTTNSSSTTATAKVDFTKIKKGVGKSKSSIVGGVKTTRKDPFSMYAAQLIDADDDSLSAQSRFQLLADAKTDAQKLADEDVASHERSLSKGKSVVGVTAKKPITTTTQQGGKTTTTSIPSKNNCTSKSSGRRNRNGQMTNTVFAMVWRALSVVVVAVIEYVHMALCWLKDLFVDVTYSTLDLTVYAIHRLFTSAYHRTVSVIVCIFVGIRSLITAAFAQHRTGIDDSADAVARWRSIANRITYWLLFKWARKKNAEVDDWGLSANIDLPSTGDEAIARLHNCRCRDAYSILGLRHDCTDDDIKRYYRRQAVLVHPDKNCTAGSDEAFKILAAAFELVSTPERRAAYNTENRHRRQDVRQLHELMQQLRTKMEEALSTMHCDCGVRHRRYLLSGRTQSSARYCARCDDRHPAKDNDIWAETKLFGFLWYYYVCVGGQVYDITEWAGCSHNQLKHMKSNSHTVQYRLMSLRSGVAGQHSRQESPDAAVDQLLNRLAAAAAANTSPSGDLGSIFANGGSDGNSRLGRSQEKSTNSTTATYQPPERNDDSRPRKATRRRKVK